MSNPFNDPTVAGELYNNPVKFQTFADTVHASKRLKTAIKYSFAKALAGADNTKDFSLNKSRKVLEALREIHKIEAANPVLSGTVNLINLSCA